jgi:ABC-type sulfate/molybdate transport systems ATPase subunit
VSTSLLTVGGLLLFPFRAQDSHEQQIVPSAEALEHALEDFEGAVLVISHGRYFLDQVVDRLVELDNGSLRSFLGGYTDYLAAKQ